MARTDAGLTISELSKRAGVSRDTISNAEKGQHSPQAPTLHKLARALGKTPSELLAQEEKLAPKVESRSSLEPTLPDGLEEERRGSVVAEAVAAAAEIWAEDVANPDIDDSKRSELVKRATQLSDLIGTPIQQDDWEAIPLQERHEILITTRKLDKVTVRGIKQLNKETGERMAQALERAEMRRIFRERNRQMEQTA